MNSAVKILLIEDETPIRKFLQTGLGNTYQVVEAVCGKEGIHAVATHNPALIILDLGLPDMDGLEVTRKIREFSSIPIIVLSARGQELDKVGVLDAGADDYLTKPFSLGELLARIRVAIRHTERSQQLDQDPVFENNGLKVDLADRKVLLDDNEIRLTPIEFKLLSLLVRNAGKVLTHSQLLSEAWGSAYVRETQYLRVFMKNLRQKLKDNPANPRFIITEPGIGYRFRMTEANGR